MNDGLCDRTEAAVAAALTGAATGTATVSGALPPELEAHARSCAACSDALLVGGLLARDAAELAAAIPPASGPPPADVVWRRARARLDADAVERATRPIAVFRKVAWAVGVMAWIGAMWRLAPAAKGWLGQLRGLDWPGAEGWWELPSGAGLTGDGMLVAAAAAVLFAVFYGVWAVWAEEA